MSGGQKTLPLCHDRMTTALFQVMLIGPFWIQNNVICGLNLIKDLLILFYV
jgi:hypothetical protein